MKDVKRRFEWFSFYDREAIEKHLENMAEQGWMIENVGRIIWRYRRIEPKKLHISVTCFPEASSYDAVPTEGQLEMREYCARDGWEFATQWGCMQIFYNEAEDPTPIETDAVTWVENINKSNRTAIPYLIIVLSLLVISLFMSINMFCLDRIDFLSSQSELALLPIGLLGPVIILLEMWGNCHWYKRAKTAAESGEFLENKIGLPIKILVFITLFLSVSFALFTFLRWWQMLVLMAAVLIIAGEIQRFATRQMKKRKFSRKANYLLTAVLGVVLALTIAGGVIDVAVSGIMTEDKPAGSYTTVDGETVEVYNDPIPLNIQDLTNEYNNEWSAREFGDESFLLAEKHYYQKPLTDEDVPWLRYDVIEVKAPFLYNYCKNIIKSEWDETARPTDASPWGAKEVYFAGNQYLLCYEKRIVEICLPWTPTTEQMAVFAEKFK